MQAAKYMRAEELLGEGVPAPGRPVDFTPMLGTWFNTDKGTGGVTRMILEERDGQLTLHSFGADPIAPRDWGKARATAYSASAGSHQGMAFSGFYDFGFMETLLAAYMKSGILVLDTFNTFKDGSGRANYFSREFFHR
jgi:hypothetical protein